MSSKQNNRSISAESIDFTSYGNDDFNVVSSLVEVGGDINHVHNTYNVTFLSDLSQLATRIPRTTGTLDLVSEVVRQAIHPSPDLSPQAHGVSLATRPLEDVWCREIVEDIDTVELGLITISKIKAQPITAVFSRELEDKERVYLQLKESPSTILEFKPQRNDWMIVNRINVPDAAAPATRLAAVCGSGGKQIHLFYITSGHTIKDMTWSPEDGWQLGKLFGGKSPKVSPWSTLSALRSANCIKLFYQRDDMICELSYGLGDRTWSYKELARADRGSPIASTSYPDADSTIYHVYFQLEGSVYECKTDKDGTEVEELEMNELEPFPPQCSSLVAISWFTRSMQTSTNTRIYYVAGEGEICQWCWDNKLGWRWNALTIVDASLSDGGYQITALQMMDGSRIRVYYVSCDPQSGGVALKQIAFSRSINTPKVNTICSGFA